VPPEGEESIDGRKERQVWKWERVLMEKQRDMLAAERERKGDPFTIPALFIRMVGGPIWGLVSTALSSTYVSRSIFWGEVEDETWKM
jgi:hypothetical protein